MPPSRAASPASAAGPPSAANASAKPWPSAASKRDRPAVERRLDRRRHPGEGERVPARAVAASSSAPRRARRPARGRRRAARARCRGAPSGARRAQPREAVDLRAGVAERERDAVRRRRRAAPLAGGRHASRPGRAAAARVDVDRGALDVVGAARRRAARIAAAGHRDGDALIAWRRNSRRMSARVGGSRNSSAEDVGDEPGGQQQRAAEDDQHAVGDLARGHPAAADRLVEAAPRDAALRAHEQRAEDRVDDEQPDRPPDADRLAHLDDHRELGDRHDDEEGDEQEGHGPEGYAPEVKPG